MNENQESDRAPKGVFRQSSEPARGTLAGIRFFERADWLSFGVTAVLVLAVYLFTLAPDVTLVDSGAFSVGAMYAGVPCPPGYPVWTLYAHVFTLLPFLNVAWRVALSSAVAGALTCGVIALMASGGAATLIESISEPDRITPGEKRALRLVSSCVAGMAFGFDGCFWNTAVTADPWPLSMLLLAIVLCFLMRWTRAPFQRRYLYFASFVYGLAFSNSQILLTAAFGLQMCAMFGSRRLVREICLANSLLFVAGLAAQRAGYFFIIDAHVGEVNVLRIVFFLVGIVSIVTYIVLTVQTRRLFTEWKVILVCGATFLLGLGAYLYEPIASMTDPPLNWAYPRTAEGFVHLVTRGQYERLYPTSQLAAFLKQLQMYAHITITEFGLLYTMVALLPIYYFRRMSVREQRWVLELLAVYLSLVFFLLVVLNPPVDTGSREPWKMSFSASHMMLAVLSGYGLTVFGVQLCGRQSPTSPR